MTQKELDYVEDAINHEKNLASIIEESMNVLEDEELTEFLQEELKHHKAWHKKLMKLLEDKKNE